MVGSDLAMHESEVTAQLNRRNIRITRLRQHPARLYSRITQRMTPKDINQFTRQWGTMLSSGIPIIASLQLIAERTHKAEMRSILFLLSQRVQSGLPTSVALSAISPKFDSLYIALVQAGEQTGNLGESLCRIAESREKIARLKSTLIRVSLYPAVVILTAVFVIYVILSHVIPEFEIMLNSYDAQLPPLTQGVLYLSSLAQTHHISLLIGAVFLSSTLTIARHSSKNFAIRTSELVTRLPVVGGLIVKTTLARYSRTLSTCVRAGIPVISCLTIAAKTADHPYYQSAFAHLLQKVNEGSPISTAMRHDKAFPPLMTQMIMIGEESGQLDTLLNHLADTYEEEVDISVDYLIKILEPLLVVLLGGLIGILVLAMYLPIFNLMSIMG